MSALVIQLETRDYYVRCRASSMLRHGRSRDTDDATTVIAHRFVSGLSVGGFSVQYAVNCWSTYGAS